jgi:8-oxo-dGTP pyrophosphatase MutT (NUDIX family)
MSKSQKTPARWDKLGHAVTAKTVVFELQSVRYRHPARGSEKDFVVVRAPDWVNVLALTPDGALVLVRQFRFGIDALSLEIPGGVMEAGEDPVEAGLRELREETGFTGKRARLLGSVHPNPAIQSNRCHFVFVEDALPTEELEWDEHEEIEVLTAPADEVLALARGGAVTHGLVLNALFLFEPHWRARNGSAV